MCRKTILFGRISRFFPNKCRGRVMSPEEDSRSFQRDIEEDIDDVQYNTTFCLSSSYYSVFMVRLAIMVMLAILIGLLTLLTWHITRVYTTKSLDTLAYGLRHELLQRPLLRMWNILNSTVEVATAQVKLSESVIRRYNSPSNQARQIELYEVMKDVTWALFASRKALNSITLSYRNGFVQAFHRNHISNNTYYIYSDLTNYSITTSSGVNLFSSHQSWNDQSIHTNISATWYREPLDPLTGDKIGKPKPVPPDDQINIAGISQLPEGTPSWHIAVSKYTNSPLLSAALPVWDPSNENIVAVVGVTTAFYSVGQLMRELVEFHSGHIYLTSEEGWLLATSTNTPLLSVGPKLIMAVNSEDDVISSGAKYLQKAYGDKFPHSQQIHIENAKIGHKLYYIDSFFLNLKRLPMVGVIIIPRNYIMGKVDEKAFKTLMILISASVCILVVGCFCIFILTNGVSKEMKLRAALICHLDARRKAEASSNYKTQFLANMSHELRTPMAAVIGLLDILMSDDCLTNEQHSMVTQIRKCSTALLRLLNNILDISKVESGKLALEETEFDLGRELEGLMDMFSVQCINHNVETVLDLSDDMPKVVKGDSGRVLQIFANLISNSIKFTTSGYIILRGWCASIDANSDTTTSHKESWWAHKTRIKREVDHGNMKKNKKMALWFEVDDSGCGIDPSKWESVFESFEQADPSTTRLHGGTGLGLCIVRTLVNKMNGEIKVIKKNGTGTLMQLHLVLDTPLDSNINQYRFTLEDQNLSVLLALNGCKTRSITTQWLHQNGIKTWHVSNWNELSQSLEQFSEAATQNSFTEPTNHHKAIRMTSFVIIIIDILLLDFTSEIWKQQMDFLENFCDKAKFAWILHHDTSNSIKTQLRKRGHELMINGPLYKGKMIQIFEAIIKEKNIQSHDVSNQMNPLEIEALDVNHRNVEFESGHIEKRRVYKQGSTKFWHKDEETTSFHNRDENEDRGLEGLCVLLAEDNPVLQRVATMMLEKKGAKVVIVGDGMQAVDAVKGMIQNECWKKDRGEKKTHGGSMAFDLILMDCQMPNMDGYEATKAIRRIECGTKSVHIPIVALTAHAMSSDEAKCLQVGMDAYLTKPIDCKQMVSTILSLTHHQGLPFQGNFVV